ncbi:MAG: peptidoglycan DD-metalloendopeptidase family protein [Pseudomonadales bacterium]
MKYRRFQSTLTYLAVTLLMTACQSSDPRRTPVSEIGQGGDRGWHVVQRGDTLYSIAWRYGLDYKELADLNDISPPYTIYIDQKVRLFDKQRNRSRTVREAAKDGPPKKSDKPSSVAQSAKVTESVESLKSVQGNVEIGWRWPLDGEVVTAFSLQGDINKGLDIKGKSGDQVRAAGAGVVVYAGSGLRGYGKLIIVKHNDQYLSAYAHNRKVLVSEGDKVKAGQVIARIGGDDPDTQMLHFEIRRDGKPEDPLAYLPAR